MNRIIRRNHLNLFALSAFLIGGSVFLNRSVWARGGEEGTPTQNAGFFEQSVPVDVEEIVMKKLDAKSLLGVRRTSRAGKARVKQGFKTLTKLNVSKLTRPLVVLKPGETFNMARFNEEDVQGRLREQANTLAGLYSDLEALTLDQNETNSVFLDPWVQQKRQENQRLFIELAKISSKIKRIELKSLMERYSIDSLAQLIQEHRFPSAKKVTHLTVHFALGHVNNLVADQVLSIIEGLPNLTSLTLLGIYWSRKTDLGLEDIQNEFWERVSLLTRLEEVELDHFTVWPFNPPASQTHVFKQLKRATFHGLPNQLEEKVRRLFVSSGSTSSTTNPSLETLRDQPLWKKTQIEVLLK